MSENGDYKMKIFINAIAALCALCLLASCSPKDGGSRSTGDDLPAAQTVGESETLGASRRIAEAIGSSGLFGSSMELYVKGDELADELLEFTYGVEVAAELHVADYVISEQTEKAAYSFAFAVFGDGFVSSDADAVAAAFGDFYQNNLASALKLYDPEAYAMCEDALISAGSAQIGDKTVNFAYLIISDDNEAALEAAMTALGAN